MGAWRVSIWMPTENISHVWNALIRAWAAASVAGAQRWVVATAAAKMRVWAAVSRRVEVLQPVVVSPQAEEQASVAVPRWAGEWEVTLVLAVA